MLPLINAGDEQCTCWPFPELTAACSLCRTRWTRTEPREDLDATSLPRPRTDRRPTPVHARGRQPLHRTVVQRVSILSSPRRQVDRAAAVPVLRLGRVFRRLTEPARQSPLRGDRPPGRRPAAARLTPAVVLRPSARGLNPAGATLMGPTPSVVAGMPRSRPRPPRGPPTRCLRRSCPVRVPCRSRRSAGSRGDGTPVGGGCRADSPNAGVGAENRVTASDQHVPEGRPQYHRSWPAPHDRSLWPFDSPTWCSFAY